MGCTLKVEGEQLLKAGLKPKKRALTIYELLSVTENVQRGKRGEGEEGGGGRGEVAWPLHDEQSHVTWVHTQSHLLTSFHFGSFKNFLCP